MTSPNNRLSLEEVLDELFFSADKPSPNMVLGACKAHPEYREDIMEFAALWSSYEAASEIDEIIEDISEESVSRLQSFVLNRLQEIDNQGESVSDIDAAQKAIVSLMGASLKRAAIGAGLGTSLLLTKVLSNTIIDLPLKVVINLAEYLDVSPSGLQQCLGKNLAGSRSYKAKGVPNASLEETWESAIHSLPVSEEEKRRLLAYQEKEDAN